MSGQPRKRIPVTGGKMAFRAEMALSEFPVRGGPSGHLGHFWKRESLCESSLGPPELTWGGGSPEQSHRVSEYRPFARAGVAAASPALQEPSLQVPGGCWCAVGHGCGAQSAWQPVQAESEALSLSPGSAAAAVVTITWLSGCCMPCSVPISFHQGYHPRR